MKYLVIGNGAAGADAALALRQNDPAGEILMLSESAHPHYYRPKLIDYLSEDILAEKLYILRNEALAEKNIQVALSTKVAAVNAQTKTVTAELGKTFSYDKLLLAVGASPFVPPTEGMPLPGVFSLRDIEDADRIKTWCRGKKHIVISGGGLLGIETANALKGFCEKITVVEMASCLLSRQLDAEGGGLLRKFLEKKGLSFCLDDCVNSVSGNGTLEHVHLRSGKILDADAMIVSAGIRANVVLAKRAGLAVGKGIIVDSTMKNIGRLDLCGG